MVCISMLACYLGHKAGPWFTHMYMEIRPKPRARQKAEKREGEKTKLKTNGRPKVRSKTNENMGLFENP